MEIKIPVTDHKNFSFAECLSFLGRSEKECLHYVQDKTIQKLIVVNETPMLVEIREGDNALIADVNASEADVDYIRRYITHWLHLDADLHEFYAFAAKDAVLAPLVQQYKGLRLVGIPDLFEALTWSITGQQITLGFAYTLRQRFIQAFGHTVVIDGKAHYAYPHPAVVAALEPESLTAMQFSRSKADYIIRLSRAMVDGVLSVAGLQALDYAAARSHLVSFKGIGNWSANYVLMKYSRYLQALPLEDAGLHNALKQQLKLSAKPSLADIKSYTAHWQQHAAYATFYLWRSLY